MNPNEYEYNLYLAHHGVKGQKWGERRYQNEDGSYKAGAEGRYDPESSGKKSSGSSSGASSSGIGFTSSFKKTKYGQKMQSRLERAKDSSNMKGVNKEYRKSLGKVALNTSLTILAATTFIGAGRAAMKNAQAKSALGVAVAGAVAAGAVVRGRARVKRLMANATVATAAKETRDSVKANKGG